MVLALLVLPACDGGGANEVDPPEDPQESIVVDPVLSMSSVEVPLNNGAQGLQFFVRADMDLSWRKVTITPPPPFDEIVFNLGDTFVIAEESVALQAANQAYTKVNGTWDFEFDVTSGSGNQTQGHVLQKTVTVGGSASDVAGTVELHLVR